MAACTWRACARAGLYIAALISRAGRGSYRTSLKNIVNWDLDRAPRVGGGAGALPELQNFNWAPSKGEGASVYLIKKIYKKKAPSISPNISGHHLSDSRSE